MGRSPAYSVDDLVATAVELFAAGGVQAVTMTAVAGAVGAPSGSIYYRFPDRPSLLAAMWSQTSRAFESGFLEALGDASAVETAVDAAVWCVDWCRANPSQAAVLQAGHRALQSNTWLPVARAELSSADALRDEEMKAAARAVAASSGRPEDEAAFAMFDLPIGVIRSYLNSGRPIPSAASDRVRRIASRLLLD